MFHRRMWLRKGTQIDTTSMLLLFALMKPCGIAIVKTNVRRLVPEWQEDSTLGR
jgi:hypothetical protein